MANSKARSVCGFLDEINVSNQTNSIVVVLDNFRSHKDRKTLKKACKFGIHLAFLLSYCPDLNLTLQLWRCLKRELS
jgi:transposase